MTTQHEGHGDKSRLWGKVAVVSGAAGKRGIGRAIALRLAFEGADLVICDVNLSDTRQSENDRIEGWRGLKDVKIEIEELGRKCIAIEADISTAKEVESLADAAISKFNHIDILVNNAAVIGPQGTPLVDVVENDFRQVLNVNVIGTYLCSKAVAKKMISSGRGGKIINVSSIMGKLAGAGMGPYSASKFAVVGLTQAMALELAKYKINVNAICPGYIASEIGIGGTIRDDMRKGLSLEEATSKAYSSVVSQIPLAHAGQPEDVASVVAFLASADSDFMTGQAINVNGGSLVCH